MLTNSCMYLSLQVYEATPDNFFQFCKHLILNYVHILLPPSLLPPPLSLSADTSSSGEKAFIVRMQGLPYRATESDIVSVCVGIN